MPNWCSNEIYIKGKPERLRAFDAQFSGKYTKYNIATCYLKDQNDNSWMMTADFTNYRVVPCNQLILSEYLYQANVIINIQETEGYSFANFVPVSKEGVLNEGIFWFYDNWGTKWDIDSDICVPEDYYFNNGQIGYYFETAWSPCIPVVEAMAMQYPDLEFTHIYDEPGNGFAGLYKYKDGKLVEKIEVNDINDYYRFKQDYMDYEYCICKGCKAVLQEGELEYVDNKYVCPSCGSDDIIEWEETECLLDV